MAVSSEQLSMVMYLKRFGEPRHADFVARMERFEASSSQASFLKQLHHEARLVHDPRYSPSKQAPKASTQGTSYNRTPEEAVAQRAEEERQGMLDREENAAMTKVLMACTARAEAGERKYLEEFKQFGALLAQLYKENAAHSVRRQAKRDFTLSMAEALKVDLSRLYACTKAPYSEDACPNQTSTTQSTSELTK